jgi:hypothetical protein
MKLKKSGIMMVTTMLLISNVFGATGGGGGGSGIVPVPTNNTISKTDYKIMMNNEQVSKLPVYSTVTGELYISLTDIQGITGIQTNNDRGRKEIRIITKEDLEGVDSSINQYELFSGIYYVAKDGKKYRIFREYQPGVDKYGNMYIVNDTNVTYLIDLDAKNFDLIGGGNKEKNTNGIDGRLEFKTSKPTYQQEKAYKEEVLPSIIQSGKDAGRNHNIVTTINPKNGKSIVSNDTRDSYDSNVKKRNIKNVIDKLGLNLDCKYDKLTNSLVFIEK